MKDIKYVQFFPMSKDQLEKYAIEITQPFTHNSDVRENTPADPRLGTIENAELCSTCNMNTHHCPGHFGYIRLSVPVYNPKYIDIIMCVLKCVCASCSKLLIESYPPSEKIHGYARLKMYRDRSEKVHACLACGAENVKYVEKGCIIMKQMATTGTFSTQSASDTYRIFQRITNVSLKKIGFNNELFSFSRDVLKSVYIPEGLDHPHAIRPESFIFTNVPVIPPQARPHIIQDGDRKEDDITDIYNSIIKKNQEIQRKLDGIQRKRTKNYDKSIDDLTFELQTHVFSLIDNKKVKAVSTALANANANHEASTSASTLSSAAKTSDRKVKGYAERLSGKQGHIQLNAGGKRSDQSARDVIVSAGPTLRVNEVGFPEYIARTLTVPEYVTEWNIDYMSKKLVTKIHTITCHFCNYTQNVKSRVFINICQACQNEGQSTSTHDHSHFCDNPTDEACRKLRTTTRVVNGVTLGQIEDAKYTITTKILPGSIENVIRQGRRINVKYSTSGFTTDFVDKLTDLVGLRVGDIVERHLQDGDPVIFGRQPTISIESIQGVRVRILRHGELPFQLPVPVTPAYNADFDGDEMNTHSIQSIEGRVECLVINTMQNHIVSRQGSAPVIGSVQNTLVGMFILTRSDEFITFDELCNIIVDSKKNWGVVRDFLHRVEKTYPNVVRPGNNRIPGRIGASIVFPKTLTYTLRTNVDIDHPDVIIHRGIIQPNSGPLCKKVIGRTRGSVTHVLYKHPFSPDIACDFLSDCQYVACEYIWRRGFSFGISDCIPTDISIIYKSRDTALIECENIQRSSKSASEKEILINGALNKAMDAAPLLAKKGMNKGKNNSLVIMAESGAKGSTINNGQISGIVGQQNIDGTRVPMKLSGGTRTLPCFSFYDNSPQARGFVTTSYIDGLKPTEMWFHALSGRRGVIDTGQKTAKSGYISKKMNKKMEDFVQHSNGAVYDTNGNIVCFMYGGDGMNAKQLVTIQKNKMTFPFFVDPQFVAVTIENEMGVNIECRRPLKSHEMNKILRHFDTSRGMTECQNHAMYNRRLILSKLLLDVTLNEECIETFEKRIVETYHFSRSEHGEAVGLIAGFSMGQPSTQMTLNTFQAAGVAAKDVTLGLPRLAEILDASENPSKSRCTFTLMHERLNDIKELQKIGLCQSELENEETLFAWNKVESEIVQTKIKDLIKTTEMYFTDENVSANHCLFSYSEYIPEWWFFEHAMFKDSEIIDLFIKSVKWVLRLKMDVVKMCSRGIKIKTIVDRIENSSVVSKKNIISCVASPECDGIIDIFVNYTMLKEKSGVGVSDIDLDSITTESETSFALSSSDDTDNTLISTLGFEYVICRNVVTEFVLNIDVSGIQGLNGSYTIDKIDGNWVCSIGGRNFLDILCLTYVNKTNAICDNMHEMFKTHGIEAARMFIIKELTKILSFDGTYISPRHISLIADAMTRRGVIMPVTRDGISKDASVLARGMFEQPIENFVKSAAFGEVDCMNSMSASIMMGKVAKTGMENVKIVEDIDV